MDKVDWDKIPEGFDWVAVDADCWVYAYKEKPSIPPGYNMWHGLGQRFIARLRDGYFENWHDSLQHRPPKEPKIKFGKGMNIEWGPRPEKLWVGMKGVTRDLDIVTLEEIDESEGDYFQLRWSNYRCTDMGGTYAHASVSCYDIVEWEQPVVTCCDPEPEPDYKAKYEQLQQKVADLIDYRESYAELRWHYLRLEDELEKTQAELKDVYKDREKLNKIVKIIHGLGDDDATV